MGKTATATNGVSVHVNDVTGQKVLNVPDVPADATVGELIQGLLAHLNLPPNDSGGGPLSYQARLEREGRHLHATERVGDALQTGDRLTLQPNIDAGLSA